MAFGCVSPRDAFVVCPFFFCVCYRFFSSAFAYVTFTHVTHMVSFSRMCSGFVCERWALFIVYCHDVTEVFSVLVAYKCDGSCLVRCLPILCAITVCMFLQNTVDRFLRCGLRGRVASCPAARRVPLCMGHHSFPFVPVIASFGCT